jgi:UDP-N-acetylmuramyl pentapeptide phosphotransferase/UDP-N-acetylglucosamine-1-phosphate transferase
MSRAERQHGGGRLIRALATAAAVRGGYVALMRKPPAEHVHWERKNYAGTVVTVLQGTAVSVASTAIPALDPGLDPRTRAAAALAAGASGLAGTYDDFAGQQDSEKDLRGIRAHLGALRTGQVTAGMVKLGVIGAAALAAGALVRDRPLDRLLAAAVVAGTAHAVNLLDVQPGRAAKAVLAAGLPTVLRGGGAGSLAAVPVAAAAALLPEELGEQAMLGDAGAHALGAVLGLAQSVDASRGALVVRAATLVALAAVEERSNSRAVAACWERPLLTRVDALGRGAARR